MGLGKSGANGDEGSKVSSANESNEDRMARVMRGEMTRDERLAGVLSLVLQAVAMPKYAAILVPAAELALSDWLDDQPSGQPVSRLRGTSEAAEATPEAADFD